MSTRDMKSSFSLMKEVVFNICRMDLNIAQACLPPVKENRRI